MRTTSPKYRSPKSASNQAQNRKMQLLELSAKLLPQLLEKTLDSRLTALENNKSTIIQDIFNVRSDVREITENVAILASEYNHSPSRSQFSPDIYTEITTATTKPVSSIQLTSNNDLRKGGRLSPLSPMESPSRTAFQDLGTYLFSYESPKSLISQELNSPQRQARKNPYNFLLKSIEEVCQISRKELADLKSLMNPPIGVTSVMEALCILFDRKPRWAAARDLIDTTDIVSRIVHYNINELDHQTAEKIDLYVKSPLIDYKKLKMQFPAVATIWKWIRAVHYCFISAAKAHRESLKVDMNNSKEEEEIEEDRKAVLEVHRIKSVGKSNSSAISEEQTRILEEVASNLKAIPKRDFENLLAVKKLPVEIKTLFEAVCLVTGQDPDWETAKVLIKKGSILSDIEIVTPDIVPLHVRNKLREFLAHPSMQVIPLQKEFPFIEDLKIWLGLLSLEIEDIKDIEQKQIPTVDEPEQKGPQNTIQTFTPNTLKTDTIQTSPSQATIEAENRKKAIRRQNTASSNTSQKVNVNEPVPCIPMIAEVLTVLKGLKRSDFAELKRNRDIPSVKAVLDGLYLVFEAPPKVRIDLRSLGNMDYDRMVGDIDQFLTRIFRFNYEDIPFNLIIKLKEYTRQPKCAIADAKKVSLGVWVLCIWLHSLVRYGENRDKFPSPSTSVMSQSPYLKRLDDTMMSSSLKSGRGKSHSFSLSPSGKSSPTNRVLPKDIKAFGENDLSKELREYEMNNKFSLEFGESELISEFNGMQFTMNDILDFKTARQAPKLAESIIKVFYVLLTGRKLQLKELQKALPNDSEKLNSLMNINPANLSHRIVKLAEGDFKEIKNVDKQINKSSGVYAIYKWIQAILKILNQQKEKDNSTVLTKKKSEENSVIHHVTEQEEESSSILPEEQTSERNSAARKRQEYRTALKMKSAEFNNFEVEDNQNSSYLQKNLNEIKKEMNDFPTEDSSSFMTNNMQSFLKEIKYEENKGNNGYIKHWDGVLASKTTRNKLKDILTGDIEISINSIDLETYLSHKLNCYLHKINHFNSINKLLNNSGVSEQLLPKDYSMKAGTASFIKMIEPDWIKNLINQPYWDDLICKILAIFATIYGNSAVLDLPNNTELREQITDKLRDIQDNSVEALLEIGSHLELDTKATIKMQKLIRDQKDILNPRTFDGIDGFCGVLSFLLKEVCEYLGILPVETVKKLNAKERLYLFNQKKIEYYESQVQKIYAVAEQYQLNLEA